LRRAKGGLIAFSITYVISEKDMDVLEELVQAMTGANSLTEEFPGIGFAFLETNQPAWELLANGTEALFPVSNTLGLRNSTTDHLTGFVVLLTLSPGFFGSYER
jgi:hypothetical protein